MRRIVDFSELLVHLAVNEIETKFHDEVEVLISIATVLWGFTGAARRGETL